MPADLSAVVSVAEVSRMVEGAVRQLPRSILVRGDLINVRHGTHHVFASLRDRGVAVGVFIHSQVVRRLDAVPTEGTGVVVRASPSWYRARGDLQLDVHEIWIEDPGRARREAVGRLRLELEREGLMRANRLLHLPHMPAAVAVVGGQGSAAVLDVVHAVHRRSPRTYVHFQPTRLQGAGAEVAIAAAIRAAAGSGAEVVAVVRGGGGTSDFSPFDSREVCEAIAASPVPIVSALGHEQDRTLADDAAHSSASTPADAARVLVADVADVRREIGAARRRLYLALRAGSDRLTETDVRRRERLASAIRQAADRGRLRLRGADVGARLGGLRAAIEHKRSTATTWRDRLIRTIQDRVAARRNAAREQSRSLGQCAEDRLRAERTRLGALQTRTALARPEAIVARGFVIARSVDGQPVTSARVASALEALELQFADGTVRVTNRTIPNEGGGA